MMPDHEPDLRAAEQAVFDEQESNARATAGTSPRDEDQADELAGEAAEESAEAVGE
jgi:hypothetical protein